jgi:hypothetical protein
MSVSDTGTESSDVMARRYAVAQLAEAQRCKLEGHGFSSRWGHQSFPTHYGPGVDSASRRNESEGCLMGVKAASA